MALVTVWMTAYNHEKYIAQALDGILMQQTSFEFDIVLGEDCSTDRTREIILEYDKKYPGKFRLFLPEKNLGMTQMTKPTYAMCQSKYLAFLDGDDYWTDPFKLQKQVNFMESNPAFSFCFHNVKIYEQHTGNSHVRPYEESCFFDKEGVTILDFLELGNRIWTLSVLMRNVLGKQLPEWYYQLPFPDLGMYFLLLKYGNGYYLDETMGVYRVHRGGVWSTKSDYYNNDQSVRFYQLLKNNTDFIDKEKINEIISRFALECLKIEIVTRKYHRALPRLFTLLRVKPSLLKENKTILLSLLYSPFQNVYKKLFP